MVPQCAVLPTNFVTHTPPMIYDSITLIIAKCMCLHSHVPFALTIQPTTRSHVIQHSINKKRKRKASPHLTYSPHPPSSGMACLHLCTWSPGRPPHPGPTMPIYHDQHLLNQKRNKYHHLTCSLYPHPHNLFMPCDPAVTVAMPQDITCATTTTWHVNGTTMPPDMTHMTMTTMTVAPPCLCHQA